MDNKNNLRRQIRTNADPDVQSTTPCYKTRERKKQSEKVLEHKPQEINYNFRGKKLIITTIILIIIVFCICGLCGK